MGIKPSGDTPIIVPPDNVQSRWGEWEADIDHSGQVAGEVFAETHAIAESSNVWISENGQKLQRLLDDSAGFGDESKTIQQQMRELIDPDNPDSELWSLQNEVNRLSTERDNAQDMAISLLGDVQELQTQQITRMLPVIGESSGNEDEYARIYRNGNYWDIARKGTWNGTGVFHGSWQTTSPVSYNNEPEVIDFSQYSTWGAAASNFNDAVLYYSVKPGIPKVLYWDVEPGALPNSGQWFTEWEMSTPTGPTREYDVLFRVTWGEADRRSYYGMRIINATSGAVLWEDMVTGIGPATPLQFGERTRSFNVKRSWPGGIPLAFQLYATGGNNQRWVNGGEITVLWVEGNQ